MLDDLSFPFNNSFADEMEGFFVPWQGDKVPDPQIVVLNIALAAELGLDPTVLNSAAGAAALSGAMAPAGASPLAMAYAGHQFGGFSAQLGDGRAILLGELIDTEGRRRDLHLKGSGRTPFSRGGDGKAVLGPVLREYLMGEAMHALGVPTTRALAAVTTGEEIARNGLEKGAVLARIAASHLRVGTFQFFAARGETEKLRKLADYAIARHFPDIVGREDRYLEFFRRVRDAQAEDRRTHFQSHYGKAGEGYFPIDRKAQQFVPERQSARTVIGNDPGVEMIAGKRCRHQASFLSAPSAIASAVNPWWPQTSPGAR